LRKSVPLAANLSNVAAQHSFVVGERAIKENWAKAFGAFDVFYQETPDGRP
jgi:hypothetical protein